MSKTYAEMSKAELQKAGQIFVTNEEASAIIEKHGGPVRMKPHGSGWSVLYYDTKQKEK